MLKRIWKTIGGVRFIVIILLILVGAITFLMSICDNKQNINKGTLFRVSSSLEVLESFSNPFAQVTLQSGAVQVADHTASTRELWRYIKPYEQWKSLTDNLTSSDEVQSGAEEQPSAEVGVSAGAEANAEAEPNDDLNTIKEATKPLIEYAGKVYLTFDDGPSKHTGAVLDELAAHHILATFFVLGEKVERYPELAKRIVDEGHSIGNHTYNHNYDELYRSPQKFVEQIMETMIIIEETTKQRTLLFRAPGGTYGNFDRSYQEALEQAGFIIFDWNIDSRDSSSRNITAEQIVSNVKEGKLSDRTIVLMHDSATSSESVKALPEIIEYFQQLNYQFLPLTSAAEPLVAPIASTNKWNRDPLSSKQAEQLKAAVDESDVVAP